MTERINNRVEYDNVQQDISAELQDQGDAERAKRIAAVHDKMAALAMGEMTPEERMRRRIEILRSSPLISEPDFDERMRIIRQDTEIRRINYIKSITAANAPYRRIK